MVILTCSNENLKQCFFFPKACSQTKISTSENYYLCKTLLSACRYTCQKLSKVVLEIPSLFDIPNVKNHPMFCLFVRKTNITRDIVSCSLKTKYQVFSFYSAISRNTHKKFLQVTLNCSNVTRNLTRLLKKHPQIYFCDTGTIHTKVSYA